MSFINANLMSNKTLLCNRNPHDQDDESGTIAKTYLSPLNDDMKYKSTKLFNEGKYVFSI
ncbi:hypothetical protein BLOT_003711 [Blomia tropicalis]|nr:hypothetical protein BLOT_003711 [Blomia tropicalis]